MVGSGASKLTSRKNISNEIQKKRFPAYFLFILYYATEAAQTQYNNTS